MKKMTIDKTTEEKKYIILTANAFKFKLTESRIGSLRRKFDVGKHSADKIEKMIQMSIQKGMKLSLTVPTSGQVWEEDAQEIYQTVMDMVHNRGQSKEESV